MEYLRSTDAWISLSFPDQYEFPWKSYSTAVLEDLGQILDTVSNRHQWVRKIHDLSLLSLRDKLIMAAIPSSRLDCLRKRPRQLSSKLMFDSFDFRDDVAVGGISLECLAASSKHRGVDYHLLDRGDMLSVSVTREKESYKRISRLLQWVLTARDLADLFLPLECLVRRRKVSAMTALYVTALRVSYGAAAAQFCVSAGFLSQPPVDEKLALKVPENAFIEFFSSVDLTLKGDSFVKTLASAEYRTEFTPNNIFDCPAPWDSLRLQFYATLVCAGENAASDLLVHSGGVVCHHVKPTASENTKDDIEAIQDIAYAHGILEPLACLTDERLRLVEVDDITNALNGVASWSGTRLARLKSTQQHLCQSIKKCAIESAPLLLSVYCNSNLLRAESALWILKVWIFEGSAAACLLIENGFKAHNPRLIRLQKSQIAQNRTLRLECLKLVMQRLLRTDERRRWSQVCRETRSLINEPGMEMMAMKETLSMAPFGIERISRSSTWEWSIERFTGESFSALTVLNELLNTWHKMGSYVYNVCFDPKFGRSQKDRHRLVLPLHGAVIDLYRTEFTPTNAKPSDFKFWYLKCSDLLRSQLPSESSSHLVPFAIKALLSEEHFRAMAIDVNNAQLKPLEVFLFGMRTKPSWEFIDAYGHTWSRDLTSLETSLPDPKTTILSHLDVFLLESDEWWTDEKTSANPEICALKASLETAEKPIEAGVKLATNRNSMRLDQWYNKHLKSIKSLPKTENDVRLQELANGGLVLTSGPSNHLVTSFSVSH
eukprot:Gregarina_sp_Pseudo_9__5093@NODE_535_length_2616_cov_16_658906_g505_i0_p1_GENE_NODE_535_length_2616_cov_16_658906_g505_i0NODE_535_length_2616_cov_16_658906_g505_i0_p1_ORF_typecomplete_len773_score231_53_NODE_535_length_2616_cov_16_658906_g505_i01352453